MRERKLGYEVHDGVIEKELAVAVVGDPIGGGEREIHPIGGGHGGIGEDQNPIAIRSHDDLLLWHVNLRKLWTFQQRLETI